MTDDQLHDAIAGDPQAKALADAGNDAGCAARLGAILPPSVAYRMIDQTNIMEAFGDPLAALAFMAKLQAVAGSGSPIAPALAATLPYLTTPGTAGLNAGSPALRAMLDMLATAGAIEPGEAAAVKALAETPAAVDFNQVSRAWLRYRPDGEVGA